MSNPEQGRAVGGKDSTGVAASAADQALVRSLRSILRQLDEEYERECENLRATLPDTNVKKRALAMLAARHLQRRENYARELAALLDGTE